MTIRAQALLTLSMCRRYAREPRVVRSVVWPIFLTPVTLAATLLLLTLVRGSDRTVAVPEPPPAELVHALEAGGFEPRSDPDPSLAVDAGRAAMATDGATLWTAAHPDVTLSLEEVLRRQRHSGWVPVLARRPPDEQALKQLGGLTLRPLAVLFVLYALVFSLGAITRDRDAEILDVEQSLPLPASGPVLARWAAAVLVLAPAHTLAVMLLQVVMPSDGPWHFALRGAGAIAAAAAVGVAAAGGSGRQGFSGPFAVGSILVAGSAALGPSIPFARDWLPVFTLFTDAQGLSSLAIGLALGPVGAWLYVRRSTGAS